MSRPPSDEIAARPPGGLPFASAGPIVPWVLLVAFAVATAGCVDHAAAAAVAGFFLLAAWLARGDGRAAPLAPRLAVGAALVVCVVQLIPLPEALRSVIAPGPASARSDLHALGLAGRRAPISVDVGETATEALLWAGAAAALSLLGGRAASRDGAAARGARVAIGALVVLHVVAWLDWASGVRVFPLTHIQDPWHVGQERLRRSDFAGWLIDRNHWAALGLVLWPLAWSWARGGGRLRLVVGAIATLGVIVSVVTTRSRAGVLLAAAQVGVVAVVTAWRLRGRSRVVALAAFAVVVAAVVLQLGRWTARVDAESATARRDLYVAVGRMALDSPWVGWGMGTFEGAFPAYQPDAALYHYAHAHDDPLEWWSGGGLFGLALLAGLAATTVQGARRAGSPARSRLLWTLAVAGGAAASLAEFPLQIPAVRFVWLGVLFAGPPPGPPARDEARAAATV